MGAAEAIAMIPSEPVAIHIGRPPEDRKPLMPDQVESAGLLLWLDANDMDGDGREDDPPPRRGAVIGWRSRVGDVKLDGFVFYQPNVQNGKGIASWETIWIQNLNKPVSGFQTIIMVRREHDLSSECTAPWRELNDLIGVGRYGETLISEKVSDEIRNGAVYLDGVRVDPFKTPMTKGFYLITYEFPHRIERGFRTTEGHYEGAIAECLVYDGKLIEEERKEVEEYLRRKWLSAVDLF